MQFGSMLVYCTVYNMCVGGGPHQYFFRGAPNPLATALPASHMVIHIFFCTFYRYQILSHSALFWTINDTRTQQRLQAKMQQNWTIWTVANEVKIK